MGGFQETSVLLKTLCKIVCTCRHILFFFLGDRTFYQIVKRALNIFKISVNLHYIFPTTLEKHFLWKYG